MSARLVCLTLALLFIGLTATDLSFAAEQASLPYKAEPALTPLKVDQPLALVAPPGETNRLFIVEKKKGIVVVPDLTKRPDGAKRVSADRVRQIALIPTITSFGIDPRTGDILLACLAQGVVRLAPASASQ